MKPIRFSRYFPLLAVLFTSSAAHAQWQTYDTVPPGGTQAWVFYNHDYNGTPPNDYPGAWGVPNSWPPKGASVTIRHEITLNNSPYLPTGDPNFPVVPFPGDLLTVSSLNIVAGGWLQPTLGELAFNGTSVWSGGTIGIGTSHNGLIHNQGILSVTGPFVLTRNGSRGMLNTEDMRISSTFGIQGGGLLRNQSGMLPDASVAELVLTEDGAQVTSAAGGGGAPPYIANEGVLRKTGSGTSTFNVSIQNHADSARNQAGTIAVNEGTLLLNAESTFFGLKAEIAPSALLILRGSHVFENGNTTVTGGGVLRLEPVPGTSFHAASGTLPTLSAPEGKLECDGAQMRNFNNQGSINITSPSSWTSMVNEGHVRMQADLQIVTQLQNGTPANLTAVFDLENNASFTQFSSPVMNYALLRKTGPGTAVFGGEFNNYSATDPLAGRIEIEEGSLNFPNSTTFENGARIRVAHGAVMELGYRHYQNSGTIHVTGSGKLYLNSGSFLSPALSVSNVPNPGTLNAAPGTFELRGGTLYGPVTNAGELTVTNPTVFNRSFIGDNPVTNSGTIHCTATSAGAGNSITLVPLVRIACTPASVLAFDIAGRPAQTGQWARLTQQGQSSVTYDGTLRINFGNLLPVSGDRWLVIDNSSGVPNTGDFASVEFTNVPAGFTPTFEKITAGIRVGVDAAATPTDYATWASAQNFPAPADAAFDIDFDHDGLPNGAEYALGTDPKTPTGSPATVIREDIGGDEFLAARFTRPGSADRGPDVQWIGEGSYDLTDWSADKAVMEYGPPDAFGKETVTVRLAEPIDYHPHAFVRLRLVKTP